MSSFMLSWAERQAVTAAIRLRLLRIDPKLLVEPAIDAPGGFRELEQQLDRLVDIVGRCTGDRIEPFLAMIIDEWCPQCPWQVPSGACPLRENSQCLLTRHIRPIVQAIQDCLTIPPLFGANAIHNREARIMFKRILVGIDHSESTPRVIQAAAELASKFGASVSLLHAVEVPLPLTPATVFESAAVEETLRDHATKFLEELHQDFPAEVTVQDMVASGCACDQIVAAARNWKADLVIVGDLNRRGLSRFLLGSTADAVIRRAPCPVLVIRPTEPEWDRTRQAKTESADFSYLGESI